jgi:AcrR family transcriptional regulator
MKTEYRLAEELKIMMAEIPLDEISVSALAKRCDVRRQTFYYHFHDVYDLLTLVFLNEKIDKIQKVNNPQNLLECIYAYYIKNQKFIDAALISAGRDLFEKFINNACQSSFMKIIHEYDSNKLISLNDRKKIARFYSYAYSNTITFYLASSKKKDLNGLLNQFNFLNADFLKILIDKLKR